MVGGGASGTEHMVLSEVFTSGGGGTGGSAELWRGPQAWVRGLLGDRRQVHGRPAGIEP